MKHARSWIIICFVAVFVLGCKGTTQDARVLAEQGDAKAQYKLGMMYENGEGVPQDYVEAIKWYRKAAEQGDAAAQANLGAMYVDGHGVPKDYVEASVWINLAFAQGDDLAIKYLSGLQKNLTPSQILEAKKKYTEWLESFCKGKLSDCKKRFQLVPANLPTSFSNSVKNEWGAS